MINAFLEKMRLHTPMGSLFTALERWARPRISVHQSTCLPVDGASPVPAILQVVSWSVGGHNPSYTAPWNSILHCEEVVPGNPLKPTNERKLVALYWSWLQYGRLYREHVHPKLFRVDRSVHMKKIRGGHSFRIPKRRARRRPSLKRKPCNRRVHRLSGGPARKNSSAE